MAIKNAPADFNPTPQQQAAYNMLRRFFNPSIFGGNTDAVLWSLSMPGASLIQNVQAVNSSMYIATATDRYLEQRLADFGIQKPGALGLSDDVFRELGLAVINRKMVRDLINKILEIMYGVEYSRATVKAQNVEPYSLVDGDYLYLQFDDQNPVQIKFQASQFQDIAAATAQETADAITRTLQAQNFNGYANVQNDGDGNYVMIISPTTGPSSTLRVLGGRSQNVLQFPGLQPTTQDATTQWTLTIGDDGNIRMTWTAGTNPSPGKLKAGDYVNIYGGPANPGNIGTFTITAVQGGLLGDAYVEYANPLYTLETFTQGNATSVQFYQPIRHTVISAPNFATSYQSQQNVLQVFLPAITKVVRRLRIGSVHLKESALPLGTQPNDVGSYIFDTTKPYAITQYFGTTSQIVTPATRGIIQMADSSQLPDEAGNLCFGFGTANEEGPVPYIGRPSDGTIYVSPAYTFKKTHPIGEDVSLIGVNAPYKPLVNGLDYPFYITDVAAGAAYAEELINQVAAAGITVVFVVLFPGDKGLGRWGRTGSEKTYVFGENED
jgi:hypothetical protein